MAVIATVQSASKLGSRSASRALRRRHRVRQAVIAAFVSALSFGTFAEVPAVDLLVKLRANSARKAETMTLEDLAALVDEIDRELQRKGRVTVKQPDVWGQNRLTSRRARYNEIMQSEEDKFELMLNTYVGTVDNAALTYEMRARQQFPGVDADGKPVEGDLKTPKDLTKDSEINVQVNSARNLVNPESGSSPNSALSNANSLKLANKDSATGIGLEPTIRIDEKSRYIQHVQQLLRNNTGDDKTDMPGYGLYLVRMPVSIMPGSNTMRDNGAVVTAEIKHNLTGDLLKSTIRKATIREATFALSQNLRRIEMNPKGVLFEDGRSGVSVNIVGIGAANVRAVTENVPKQIMVPDPLNPGSHVTKTIMVPVTKYVYDSPSPNGINPKTFDLLKKALGLNGENTEKSFTSEEVETLNRITGGSLNLSERHRLMLNGSEVRLSDETSWNNLEEGTISELKTIKVKMTTELANQVRMMNSDPFMPDLKGLYWDVDDFRFLYEEWNGLSNVSSPVHRPDLFLWLNQQMFDVADWLEKLMKHPKDGAEIQSAASDIRDAYRSGQLGISRGSGLSLEKARARLFRAIINAIHHSDPIGDTFLQDFVKADVSDGVNAIQNLKNRLQIRNRFTFAYTYLLYGEILNGQIKSDMKVMAERKGLVMDEAELLDFDCFNPDDLAKSFFTDYVQAKWPIQVFSLDPAIDQQNEADSLSRRSDLQVALAQSVANGTTELNQALQYARKIEQEFATIGLNRTAVGFNAGATTFGWKFYPRFQTPPPQNNPQRIGSLILNGAPSRRYDMAQRRIEPGPRECVALVVAPNFVPSLRMTTTTNWFDLTPNMHHGNEKISNADMIRLGRQITMARHAFQRLCDDGHYRPGDIERLQDRITQLENMLPTQTMDIQLPFEGDWYGMELFASDGARLAPKLFMWYGEPASPSTVKVKRELGPDLKTVKATYEDGTIRSVFLIGQGFSIAETKVIVGGVPVPSEFVELMSRNILRIQIPTDAASIKIEGEHPREVIDVHVATPNGVSNHLYVDTISEKPKSKPGEVPNFGMSVDAEKSTATAVINVRRGPDGQYRYVSREVDHDSVLKIKVADPAGLAATEYSLTLQFKNRKPLTDIRATFNNKGEFIVNASEIETIFDYIDSFSPGSVIPGFDPDVEKSPDFQTLTTGILAQPSKLNQRDAILSSLRLKIDGTFTFNFELMIAPQLPHAESAPANHAETGDVGKPASPQAPLPSASPDPGGSSQSPPTPVAPAAVNPAAAPQATSSDNPQALRSTQDNPRTTSGTSDRRNAIHAASAKARGNSNRTSIEDLPPALTPPSNGMPERTESDRGASTEKARVSGTNSPFGARTGNEPNLNQRFSADERTASQKTGIPLPR